MFFVILGVFQIVFHSLFLLFFMGILEDRLRFRERENLINPDDPDAEVVDKVLTSGLMRGEHVVFMTSTSGYY